MKRFPLTIVFISCLSFLFLKCQGKVEKNEQKDSIVANTDSSAPDRDFLTRWDFDQDGINDSVTYEFSGGAHCCYTIKIWTSKLNKVWDFSQYEMDGGYVMGLDDSQPDHFNIKNFDEDPAPEIFIESGTYNGDYSMGGRQVLLDYKNDYFFEQTFDIYLYERSKKNITCRGKNGFTGFYRGWDNHSSNALTLGENNEVDFSSGPRGVGGWEINYRGSWKMKEDTLIITYTDQYYLDMPDHPEKLKEIIHAKFLFSSEDCMLNELNSSILYYKE